MTQTKETISQTLIDPDKLRQWLESMGYKLIDCGSFWRARALYRQGKNNLSLQIYKNTGVWTDYGIGGKPKPFEALVKITNNGDEGKTQSILKDFSSKAPFEYIPRQLITMDKIYEESSLQRLFPNYAFYNKKNISEDTQKFFRVGLAGVGKMYRRMVFPIYNEHKQIIGFSGRKIDDKDDYPKWKHLGKKRNWIYPAYIPAETTVDEIINETRSVILVESIGDAMALFDQGIKNVLVTFGLGVNPNMMSYLCGKSLDQIIIFPNNDTESKINNGLISAIKIFMSLSKFFNLEQLVIKVPPVPYNDFGIAYENGYNLSTVLAKEIKQEKQLTAMIAFIEDNKDSFDKADVNKFKKLCNEQS